jgi:hypothetical protein
MNKKKKKIYEIVWDGTFVEHNISLIVAKNEEQAIKRFYKKYNHFVPSIISFKEYKNASEEHVFPQEVLKDD